MSGSLASRPGAAWPSAAVTGPFRCACRPSSSLNVAQMPKVVSLSLKAYQVTVPGSAAASGWAWVRKAASSSSLPGWASRITSSPRSTLMKDPFAGFSINSSPLTGACGSGGSAENGTVPDMEIAVLAVPDLFDSGLSAVLDVLATANALREDVATSVLPFDVTVAGTESSVRTGHGLRLATTPLTELDTVPDLLVMPAVGCAFRSPLQIVDIVRNHAVVAHVAALHAAGSDLAAACTGTFFLAEAGVLDGLLATTSWWLGPAFRRRYTAARLDESRTLARDGRVTTAGAAFAHIDLALSVVAQESPALADLVARWRYAQS